VEITKPEDKRMEKFLSNRWS